MSKKEEKEPIEFKSNAQIFAEEDRKLAELKKSDKVEELLIACLMEPHPTKPFTEDNDPFGLYYVFAKAKASAIMKEFNVTKRDSSSQPTQVYV